MAAAVGWHGLWLGAVEAVPLGLRVSRMRSAEGVARSGLVGTAEMCSQAGGL